MSNSPIFDNMANRLRYNDMIATEREKRAVTPAFFAKRDQSYAVNQDGLTPDPYLDGPYRPEEPQAVTQPFVPVKGIQRGTFGQIIEPAVELKAKVLGIPASIVDNQVSQYETVHDETKFDPMDLAERGVTFTDFARGTIEKFCTDNPGVIRINFFVDPVGSFADPTETFVIEGKIPMDHDPDEIMIKPLPGIAGVDHSSMFGVEIVGAQEATGDVLTYCRQPVADQYPGFIPGAVTAIQEHEDNPHTQPISEKNTAQPTE